MVDDLAQRADFHVQILSVDFRKLDAAGMRGRTQRRRVCAFAAAWHGKGRCKAQRDTRPSGISRCLSHGDASFMVFFILVFSPARRARGSARRKLPMSTPAALSSAGRHAVADQGIKPGDCRLAALDLLLHEIVPS
jgi:hypothetical protein